MDRVQLADNSPGWGLRLMSDTDTTQMAPRPSALGDLGLAGTIAAGLVAGTLGLGALAAPLVGWKDWTSGLERNVSAPAVAMVEPATEKPNQPNVKTGTGNTGIGNTGIGTIGTGETGTGSATPLTAVGFPGGGGVGSGTAVAVIVGGGGNTNTPSEAEAEAEVNPDRAQRTGDSRPERTRGEVTSAPESGNNENARVQVV